MKNIFNFICCGSVDDGKSTLIGRLLLDTGNVKEDQIADAIKASHRNGSDTMELSMLLDGLLSEREQQITIDIAHRYFDYNDTRFHILDCPGHEQYTKNMAIGAALADSAIVVIDCTKGILPQTSRHIEICKLFGVKNICCCLTKTDLLPQENGHPCQKTIQNLIHVLQPFKDFFQSFDIIPVSAVSGYNINKLLDKIVEYSELPKSFSHHKILHIYAVKPYKGERYYYAFPVNDKLPEVGEKYILYCSNTAQKLYATITKIVGYGCFQIAEDIDIEKGDTLSLHPLIVSNQISHQTIWFDSPTQDMLLKHGTKIAKIITHTPDIITTDVPLFISNLDEEKSNAVGIIIDNITKRTIGCAVFNHNHTNIQHDIPFIGQTYWQNETTPQTNTIVFDTQIIQQLGVDNICKVASVLNRQGYNAQIMIPKPTQE